MHDDTSGVHIHEQDDMDVDTLHSVHDDTSGVHIRGRRDTAKIVGKMIRRLKHGEIRTVSMTFEWKT